MATKISSQPSIFSMSLTLPDRLDADEGSKVHYHDGRYYPYVDIVGKVTIGCGRNLTDRGISEDEKALMQANDIRDAQAEAAKYPWYSALDAVRQGVVTMMIFNMGAARFAGFKNTIAAIAAGDYATAAQQMLDSKWEVDVGQRANRLAEMMETGEGF